LFVRQNQEEEAAAVDFCVIEREQEEKMHKVMMLLCFCG